MAALALWLGHTRTYANDNRQLVVAVPSRSVAVSPYKELSPTGYIDETRRARQSAHHLVATHTRLTTAHATRAVVELVAEAPLHEAREHARECVCVLFERYVASANASASVCVCFCARFFLVCCCLCRSSFETNTVSCVSVCALFFFVVGCVHVSVRRPMQKCAFYTAIKAETNRAMVQFKVHV